MVDYGETISEAVKREFNEEALNLPSTDLADFKADLEDMFKHGKEVYKG